MNIRVLINAMIDDLVIFYNIRIINFEFVESNQFLFLFSFNILYLDEKSETLYIIDD